MLLHYGQMNSITRRKLPAGQDNLFCAIYDRLVNRQHFIHNS